MNILCEDFISHGLTHTNPTIVFSANNVITTQGRLVMGAGAALAVRNAFPGIDRDLGGSIQRLGSDYYLCQSDQRDCTVIALQVKRDWRAPADLTLLQCGLQHLAAIVRTNPQSHCTLNCPGIGLGGLPEYQVITLLKEFLDFPNVTLCVTHDSTRERLQALWDR